MFKEMRRKDRQLDIKRAIEILEQGEYGVLSMCDVEGYGYGIPMSYTCKDNSIYFHCALEGSKIENINHNNKVSFCVVGNTKVLPEAFATIYESVIAFGTAIEAEGQEKHDALVELIQKYSPQYLEGGLEYIKRAQDKTKVIRIDIENLTAKGRLR
jgi:uncharacterized protein